MIERFAKYAGVMLASLLWSTAGSAAPGCPAIEQFLTGKAVGVVCFHSNDLRTNNALTTPANNFILTFADGTPLPGLLGGSGGITPVTDRGVISNGPTPISPSLPVPGIQVEGWFAGDATKEARFLLRFPDVWNGKLVVAGASGTRSEYNGDWAWSDYVLPKGYAYASQNKGVLNLYIAALGSVPQPSNDPLACRLNPTSTTWVHFYDNDPAKPFTQWTQYMLLTADQRSAQYRLYEVQNGNHIEAYVVPFPQLVVIQPHAQKAFDLLVDHVQSNSPLPPSQCVPKGGAISQSPGASHLGNCADLFVP